jgi:hypothetical protein
MFDTLIIILYCKNYSAFFLATFLGLAGALAAAAADFLEAVLFNLAFILLLFLETPKEPFVRFPFAVFLSPLPIRKNFVGQ